MTTPVCFLSYSWEGAAHNEWVLHLGTKLMENGVNVRLDKWDLRPGMDLFHFMEEGIRTSTHVLLVCTPTFADKANKASGGIGWEKAIVSGELFRSQPEQHKFVPLLRLGEPATALPSYLQSRLFIDFRDQEIVTVTFLTVVARARCRRGRWDGLEPPRPSSVKGFPRKTRPVAVLGGGTW